MTPFLEPNNRLGLADPVLLNWKATPAGSPPCNQYCSSAYDGSCARFSFNLGTDDSTVPIPYHTIRDGSWPCAVACTRRRRGVETSIARHIIHEDHDRDPCMHLALVTAGCYAIRCHPASGYTALRAWGLHFAARRPPASGATWTCLVEAYTHTYSLHPTRMLKYFKIR